MRKIRITIAAMVVFALPAQAQMEEFLRNVEQNNTTLEALAKQAKADKSANRTGISIPAPEIEFGRLWGRPAEIGNRTDIAISQTLDFATISGARLRQAKRQNTLVDLQYATARIEIMSEATGKYIEAVYRNRLAQVLETRLRNARTITESYARRIENGDANRLEYNKAMLNLAAAQNDATQNQTERAALIIEMERLGGGASVVATDFPSAELPENFEQWYACIDNPATEYARREKELLEHRVGLARLEKIPEFSVGYMREKTRGQAFEGVTVGLSIPLWGKQNTVRNAQDALSASTAREIESNAQIRAKLMAIYQKAAALKITIEEYQRILSETSTINPLEKALAAGEISLTQYITESEFYYDAVTRYIETQRDFHIACAQLAAYQSIGTPPCETK